MSGYPLYSLAISVFLSIFLIQAGAHKVLQHRSFRRGLLSRSWMSEPLSWIWLGFSVVVEFSLGVGWLVLIDKSVASLATALLLSGYAVFLAISVMRGETQAGCGCDWGRSLSPIRPWMIVRNLVLASLALMPMFFGASGDVNAVDILNASAFAATALFFYFVFSEMAAQQTRFSVMKGLSNA